MRLLRGGKIAFVPQNPLSSLTPHLRVGSQVAEAIRIHRKCGAREARAAALDLFEATNLPEPAVLYDRYPHELSGGQRQRVVIAAALAGNPRLVILDEPTTALDKTTESQVLDLVRRIRERFQAALVYVSHDLNVVAEMCDRVLVMLRGEVVEDGPTARVYRTPSHDYTRRLIAAVPRIDRAPPEHAAPAPGKSLLSVTNLGFRYERRRRWLAPLSVSTAKPALSGLSFEIGPGETLGLVGESGSGKSTAAALVAGLLPTGTGRARLRRKRAGGIGA